MAKCLLAIFDCLLSSLVFQSQLKAKFRFLMYFLCLCYFRGFSNDFFAFFEFFESFFFSFFEFLLFFNFFLKFYEKNFDILFSYVLLLDRVKLSFFLILSFVCQSKYFGVLNPTGLLEGLRYNGPTPSLTSFHKKIMSLFPEIVKYKNVLLNMKFYFQCI